MVCGSVDDGKSTLIGRLLHETDAIPDDHAASLARDSRRFGTTGDTPDFALVTDGLEAEREQGITIDVAYRTLATPRRRILIADAPGHEQYTRNMATACAGAHAAVLLVDARRGILPQTRRHARIARIFGLRHLVLAVNKMDLVGFDPAVFHRLAAEFAAFTAPLGPAQLSAVPISARDGDNLVAGSVRLPWFEGPSLLAILEAIPDPAPPEAAPFRMPVQLVTRGPEATRLYAGTIASGRIAPGDGIRAAGSATASQVASLHVAGEPAATAGAGDAVHLALSTPLDVARGDVLTAPDDTLVPADQFEARLVWLDTTPLAPGRVYLFRLGTATIPGSVTRIRHRIDVETGAELSALQLVANDLASVDIGLRSSVALTPFQESEALGGFVIIDRETNATVAAGVIDFALTRAANLHWQDMLVDRQARAAIKGQRPRVVWFTGLSGAGKSTVANLVERRLHAIGRHTYMIDGDNLRHGLNRDLGFTPPDRVENVRRAAEVAALLADAGLIVLVCLISPYRAERHMARDLLPAGDFLEVFVDASVEECRRRDVKGLYARADAGLIPDFTGVSAPYEPPEAPDVHLRTADISAELACRTVMQALGETNLGA